jgi:hypothetical protein
MMIDPLVLAEYFKFLDQLRVDGGINMFASPPVLADEYVISQAEAKKVFTLWMNTFNDHDSVEDRVARAQESEKSNKPEPILYLADSHGVHIPKMFVESFADNKLVLIDAAAEDLEILKAGPDHEHYWDAWDSITRDCQVDDEKGNHYHIHQEGDVWLIPVGMTWDEENDTWKWETA